MVLLDNALRQTGWTGPAPAEDKWRDLVRDRLGEQDWDQVVADVRPFLEPSVNLDVLTRDNVLRVLR